MLESLLAHLSYYIEIALILTGLYIVIANTNLVKKVVGLNIFQAGVFLMFITFGSVDGGTAPIAAPGFQVYSNPLPHVLILTAIVVGVATTAVALALTVRIHGEYRTLEEDEMADQERETEV